MACPTTTREDSTQATACADQVSDYLLIVRPPKASPLPLLQRLRHVPLAALTEIYTDYLCAQKGAGGSFWPTSDNLRGASMSSAI
jgi:hypothetical protein